MGLSYIFQEKSSDHVSASGRVQLSRFYSDAEFSSLKALLISLAGMILTEFPLMPFIMSISSQNRRSHLDVKSTWKKAENNLNGKNNVR
jgi:hypothetical protein